jgi:hypothetical protein
MADRQAPFEGVGVALVTLFAPDSGLDAPPPRPAVAPRPNVPARRPQRRPAVGLISPQSST